MPRMLTRELRTVDTDMGLAVAKVTDGRLMTDVTDDCFLQAFEHQEIPLEQWDHRAHLRVAVSYLLRYPFDEALCRMRSGIQDYNSAMGVEDSPTSGYHETITQAWLHILATMLRQYGPSSAADEFLDEHPQLAQKTLLRLFYSRERVMSPEAKQRFVEPDLAPLPRAVTTGRLRTPQGS
jgi:hypothetical protein